MAKKTGKKLLWCVEVAETLGGGEYASFHVYYGLAESAVVAREKAEALARKDGCCLPFVSHIQVTVCDF